MTAVHLNRRQQRSKTAPGGIEVPRGRCISSEHPEISVFEHRPTVNLGDLQMGIDFFLDDEKFVFPLQEVEKAAKIDERMPGHCLPLALVVVMGIVVQEMMMVFGFGNMLAQQSGEHINKLFDFVAVEA